MCKPLCVCVCLSACACVRATHIYMAGCTHLTAQWAVALGRRLATLGLSLWSLKAVACPLKTLNRKKSKVPHGKWPPVCHKQASKCGSSSDSDSRKLCFLHGGSSQSPLPLLPFSPSHPVLCRCRTFLIDLSIIHADQHAERDGNRCQREREIER